MARRTRGDAKGRGGTKPKGAAYYRAEPHGTAKAHFLGPSVVERGNVVGTGGWVGVTTYAHLKHRVFAMRLESCLMDSGESRWSGWRMFIDKRRQRNAVILWIEHIPGGNCSQAGCRVGHCMGGDSGGRKPSDRL